MPMGRMYRAPRPKVARVAKAIVSASSGRVTKQSTANEKANEALKQIRKLNKSIERKFFDYDNVSHTWTNTPAIISLTPIPQGTTDQTRVGDTIHLVSVDLSMDVALFGGTGLASFRAILFYWNVDDTGPTPPGIGQILSTPGSAVSYPIVKYRVDARQQYTIVKDISWTMDIGQRTNTIKRIRKNLKEHMIQYTAGGTTGTGKLYLAIMSDGSAANPSNIYCRVKFLDA